MLSSYRNKAFDSWHVYWYVWLIILEFSDLNWPFNLCNEKIFYSLKMWKTYFCILYSKDSTQVRCEKVDEMKAKPEMGPTLLRILAHAFFLQTATRLQPMKVRSQRVLDIPVNHLCTTLQQYRWYMHHLPKLLKIVFYSVNFV